MFLGEHTDHVETKQSLPLDQINRLAAFFKILINVDKRQRDNIAPRNSINKQGNTEV